MAFSLNHEDQSVHNIHVESAIHSTIPPTKMQKGIYLSDNNKNGSITWEGSKLSKLANLAIDHSG